MVQAVSDAGVFFIHKRDGSVFIMLCGMATVAGYPMVKLVLGG